MLEWTPVTWWGDYLPEPLPPRGTLIVLSIKDPIWLTTNDYNNEGISGQRLSRDLLFSARFHQRSLILVVPGEDTDLARHAASLLETPPVAFGGLRKWPHHPPRWFQK